MIISCLANTFVDFSGIYILTFTWTNLRIRLCNRFSELINSKIIACPGKNDPFVLRVVHTPNLFNIYWLKHINNNSYKSSSPTKRLESFLVFIGMLCILVAFIIIILIIFAVDAFRHLPDLKTVVFSYTWDDPRLVLVPGKVWYLGLVASMREEQLRWTIFCIQLYFKLLIPNPERSTKFKLTTPISIWIKRKGKYRVWYLLISQTMSLRSSPEDASTVSWLGSHSTWNTSPLFHG